MKKVFLAITFLLALCITGTASAKGYVDGDLTSGKVTINGTTPKNIDDAYIVSYLLDETFNKCFAPKDGSFSVFQYADWITDESGSKSCSYAHEVSIQYTNTPPLVPNKEEVDGIVEKLSDYTSPFVVDDLQFVDYFLYGYGPNLKVETAVQAPNFSKNYKSLTDNKNFRIKIFDQPGYGGTTFETGTGGFGLLVYDGYIYRYVSIYAPTEQVIYIPSSTPDTTSARIETATKRINDYYKNTKYSNGFSIEYNCQLSELYEDVSEEDILHSIIFDAPNFSPSNKDAYILKYQDRSIPILIQESDERSIQSDFQSTDLGTNISVSSQNHEMPYDTYVTAGEVNPEERKEILAKLGIEDASIFNISLYSETLKQLIHQLSTKANFTVSVPIPEKFKGRTLFAYYVTESGETEKYAISQKDGFAIFDTNHFSEYILGAEEDKQTEGSEQAKEDEQTDERNYAEKDIANPPTFDCLPFYIVSLITFSAVGAIALKK